jgi:ABC-2 type transport system permease protein
VSDVLPLSYAVDAMKVVTTSASPGQDVTADATVIVGWVVASLVLGSLTLRRRTP